jgi:hypothetical protein
MPGFIVTGLEVKVDTGGNARLVLRGSVQTSSEVVKSLTETKGRAFTSMPAPSAAVPEPRLKNAKFAGVSCDSLAYP